MSMSDSPLNSSIPGASAVATFHLYTGLYTDSLAFICRISALLLMVRLLAGSHARAPSFLQYFANDFRLIAM